MGKRIREDDTGELYNYLDSAASARTNAVILKDLNWSEGRLHTAKKSLLREHEIYITQEGVILQRYASTEQQIWHLGWSLGLFEVAGNHLVMDRDLLLEAPRVFQQLIDEGKFSKAAKLMEFRQRVVQTMELPRQLLAVYNQVNQIVDKEIKLLEDKEKLKDKFKRE
jgi:hypothetical protein